MNPRFVFDELFEEHRCGDCSAISAAAVDYVGYAGLNHVAVFIVERQTPHFFARLMPPSGFMEIPPVSKVIALPTSPKTGSAAAPAGAYLSTINAGGSSDPCATPQKAPIFKALISSGPSTSHCKPVSVAILRARSARMLGVRRLLGSFTRSRVKF